MNSPLDYKRIREIKRGKHIKVFEVQDQYYGENYILKMIEKNKDNEAKKKNERETNIMKIRTSII